MVGYPSHGVSGLCTNSLAQRAARRSSGSGHEMAADEGPGLLHALGVDQCGEPRGPDHTMHSTMKLLLQTAPCVRAEEEDMRPIGFGRFVASPPPGDGLRKCCGPHGTTTEGHMRDPPTSSTVKKQGSLQRDSLWMRDSRSVKFDGRHGGLRLSGLCDCDLLRMR